jgi:hypothetical protein
MVGASGASDLAAGVAEFFRSSAAAAICCRFSERAGERVADAAKGRYGCKNQRTNQPCASDGAHMRRTASGNPRDPPDIHAQHSCFKLTNPASGSADQHFQVLVIHLLFALDAGHRAP